MSLMPQTLFYKTTDFSRADSRPRHSAAETSLFLHFVDTHHVRREEVGRMEACHQNRLYGHLSQCSSLKRNVVHTWRRFWKVLHAVCGTIRLIIRIIVLHWWLSPWSKPLFQVSRYPLSISQHNVLDDMQVVVGLSLSAF